jgi:hypothetical protein
MAKGKKGSEKVKEIVEKKATSKKALTINGFCCY